jgi:hypothetical protein
MSPSDPIGGRSETCHCKVQEGTATSNDVDSDDEETASHKLATSSVITPPTDRRLNLSQHEVLCRSEHSTATSASGATKVIVMPGVLCVCVSSTALCLPGMPAGT